MTKESIGLTVRGMTCSGFVRHVERALRDVKGVLEVHVRLEDGNVVVVHDGSSSAAEPFIEALRGAGTPRTR